MKRIQTSLGIAITVGIMAVVGLQLYNPWRSDYDNPTVSPRTTSLKAGQSEQWHVVRVNDGDTIVVRRGIREERVRFCGIDAPEVSHGQQPGQAFGDAAKAYLQQLIREAGGTVLVGEVERDRYGRMVGEVFTVGSDGEKLLQEELLQAGMAYVYPQYVGSCPNAQPMQIAETIAQQNQVGVWSSEQQRPWDYRRAQRER